MDFNTSTREGRREYRKALATEASAKSGVSPENMRRFIAAWPTTDRPEGLSVLLSGIASTISGLASADGSLLTYNPRIYEAAADRMLLDCDAIESLARKLIANPPPLDADLPNRLFKALVVLRRHLVAIENNPTAKLRRELQNEEPAFTYWRNLYIKASTELSKTLEALALDCEVAETIGATNTNAADDQYIEHIDAFGMLGVAVSENKDASRIMERIRVAVGGLLKCRKKGNRWTYQRDSWKNIVRLIKKAGGVEKYIEEIGGDDPREIGLRTAAEKARKGYV